MKITLVTLFLSFLLTGCSHQNAFSKFNLEIEEEKSVSSQQDTPILKASDVVGAFSTVYLNEIKPDIYNGKEYFLISLYVKEKQILENFNNYEEKKQELEKIEKLRVEKLENIDQEENSDLADNDAKDHGLLIILNNQYPLTVEPLPQELRKHISLDADWNHCFMVIFEQTQENKLKISLHGNGFFTKNLEYEKNEE